MLLLASTSDVLRVITGSSGSIDVHASYATLTTSSGAVLPGRKNTAITTATTTSVATAPSSGEVRTVKTLTVRNKHASTSNAVTVAHYDGTTEVELFKTTLAAGECVHYHEQAGFWMTDAEGRCKNVNFTGVGTPSGSSDSIVVLASDVTNNNASANTIADVTGLSFSVLAGKLYWFNFWIVYTAAATTTGSRWSVNGPASPTYLQYRSEYSLTTTTTTRNVSTSAYDTPSASNATSAATGQNIAEIEGIIQPSADGTVIARFASEISSSAIVAKIGSFVRYRQITA